MIEGKADGFSGVRIGRYGLKQSIDMARQAQWLHIIQDASVFIATERKIAQGFSIERQEPAIRTSMVLGAIHGIAPGLIDEEPLVIRCEGRSKREVLKEVESYILNTRTLRSFYEEIRLVVDEMYTNAKRVSQPLKKQFEIRINVKDNRVTISTLDFAGRLNPDEALTIVQNCYAKGAMDAMSRDSEGAGLGLWLMFKLACSIYLCSDKSNWSVVALSIDLDRRNEEMNEQYKNIHVCHGRNKDGINN